MKFSEAWLRQWVDPDIGREALLEQLTMAGLEVEAAAPAGPELLGVVVARIERLAPHGDGPLRVCQVTDGNATHQVVCGAPNVRSGLVCALAQLGAVLPNGTRIKQADIRGAASAGMLCSAAELGLGDDDDGILELESGCTPGTPLAEALDLDDLCIELDLTPNRGDCLSLRGLAREVGVLNDLPVRHQRAAPVLAEADVRVPVRLQAPAGCPRYLGRVIDGVDSTAATPLWMQERLRRSGLRSINAVVDVTNYVMLELGQPMHAFDRAALSGPVVVRKATQGEVLKLLDGRKIELDPTVLVIADASGPVALAGIMGGIGCSVQTSTKSIFLECAHFNPLTVAATARRFGLHTDASHRYERGVDYNLPAMAMERATALLLSVVGGRAGPVTAAVEPAHLPPERRVSLRQRRLREQAGMDIDANVVDALLTRLGFSLIERLATATDAVVWTVAAPSHRFDIEIEADLIEEVCRIHGYHNIPNLLPNTPLAPQSTPLEQCSERQLKAQLAAFGFQEVITYSFVDPALQRLLDPSTQPLALANPMSSEQSVMRTTLLPGLIESLRFNRNRQQGRAQLFELGLCFKPGDPLRQVLQLGTLMWGARGLECWHEKPVAVDFFDLKGAVERLLEWAGGEAPTFAPAQDPVLHPGQQAVVRVKGEDIGRLGRLHPEIEQQLALGAGVFVFELAGAAALAHPLRKFAEIPKTPSARRDLALVVDEAASAQQIQDVLAKALGPVLAGIKVFDVYRSKGIDSNKKSIAVRLTFQSPSSTLSDAEISQFMDAGLLTLQAELGARLR